MTTIKLKPALTVLFYISAFLLFNTTSFSQEQVVIWVQLDVSATHESYRIAGDPGTRVNSTTEISFKRYGFYTINRMKDRNNNHYFVIPGRENSGRMPEVMNLSVVMTHPCVDGEGSLIGKETRNIPAQIEPPSGTIAILPLDNDQIKLHLYPTVIDAEMLECTKPNCQNGFGFEYGENVVGEDRDPTVEGEYGFEDLLGYDLLETDFSLLKKITKDKRDILLTIPISIEKVWRDDQDTPTGTESKVFTYRINGWIGGTSGDE